MYAASFATLAVTGSQTVEAQRIQQPLGRGVTAVKNGSNVLVSWRRLAQDPVDAKYNVYVQGVKINSEPLDNTNLLVASSAVPAGSDVTVSMISRGEERAQSVPYTMTNLGTRGIFMSITFDESPLDASNFDTSYVWPVDLDGDGEMDYVVNRINSVDRMDCYIEGYLRTGQHLWTVKMGPNELVCSGQDDQVLAYDIDCDGYGEVVMQTSDGTQFWDASAKTFGKYVNVSDTPDTDGDGIVEYEKQTVRNAPRYMTVVDGLTGAEKVSVEQMYDDCYNRTNKAALMGDEYNKHVGHVGVFYPDGIHPAVVMEYHSRLTDGTHIYRNGAWAFDFTTGKAQNWHQLFNEPTGGPAFHQIRIADANGDGRDEMTTGGYTMDYDGSTLFSPGISHGDRFRTSDIDPERPGLETFAIQQNASDMLGQILYDAATGESLKKWYLPAVGDVGRGECMDIDPGHLGWEMWSTMGNVYDAKGELIPELTNPYPTEGIWWDGDLDREIVETSDSHYNIYIKDFFNGRLYEIAKESGWKYLTVYAKRAAFWGDIIGDWREELILRHMENGVCVGIVGFSTDYATDINGIYCLQEDPAYRLQCTTKGYYQSPDPGFYLGYDMPMPQLPPVMVTDAVWRGTSKFTDFSRGSSVDYVDGKSVLIDLYTDAEISVNVAMKPSVLYAMPVKGQTVRLSGSGALSGDMELWKSQKGVLVCDVPLTYTGATYISEGVLELNSDIASAIMLRARGTLAGNAKVGDISFEGALNYEGCRIAPGAYGSTGEDRFGELTFTKGLSLGDKRVFMEMNVSTAANRTDLVKINGDFDCTGKLVLSLKVDESTPQPGKFRLVEYTGDFTGSVDNITVLGLTGQYYSVVNEDNAIYVEIHDQRAASNVVWTGSESNDWDYKAQNFEIEGESTTFVSGDAVEFNDNATKFTVNITDLMPVKKVTFDNSSKSFVVNGDGGFSGDGGLLKIGSGNLTLNSTKSDYTGPTVISGGTVTVKSIADGGQPSSIGASSSAAENFRLSHATLVIDNNNVATDRALVISDTAEIKIDTGVAAFKGIISGDGTLRKSGNGQLNFTYDGKNTWTGGMILDGGTIAMGTWSTSFGAASSKILANAGTIRIFDSNSSSTIPEFTNKLEIPKGRRVTMETGKRCKIRGSLLGEGTLNISFPYVRGDMFTNMSEFAGTVNVTSGQFRLAQAMDLSNGTLSLGSGVYVAHVQANSGTEVQLTTKIGHLSSSVTDATLSTGTYNVGYAGGNDTFNGVINANATLNKYGDGTLSLGNKSAGKMNVRQGTLFADNTADVISSSMVTVYNGGILRGVGNVGDVMLHTGATLGGGNIKTNFGKLTVKGTINGSEGCKISLLVHRGSILRQESIDVEGSIYMTSPIFEITMKSGVLKEDDEISFFNCTGKVNIEGDITIEPAVPCEGCLWDVTDLATKGVARVAPDPSGITDIEADAAEPENVYDLQGRSTKGTTLKGIYIVNGKKVKL